MKRLYTSQDELNADAKNHNMTPVVSKPALEYPETDPPSAYYYADDDGNIYEQFRVVDNSHLMLDGMFVHVDEVLAMGTAGTVQMPLTKTVLSVPRPDVGESLAGYFLRTSRQSGATPSQVGKFLATVNADPNKALADQRTGQPYGTNKAPLDKATGQPVGATPAASAVPQPSPAAAASLAAQHQKGEGRTNAAGQIETFDGTVWRNKATNAVVTDSPATTAEKEAEKVGGPSAQIANARAAATVVPTQRVLPSTALVPGAPFVPFRTGTPLIDWPIFVDTFTHLTAYTTAVLGGAGLVTPMPVGLTQALPPGPSTAPAPAAEGVAARRAAAATAAQSK